MQSEYYFLHIALNYGRESVFVEKQTNSNIVLFMFCEGALGWCFAYPTILVRLC